MAKVPFTKLKCKINDSVSHIEFNGEIIEVKQYLSVQEKLKLIGDVVMQAHEQDENYSNPVKADVFTDLEIVFAYTNISFTDKQKEDLPKLYDTLKSSGLLKLIIDAIPGEEYCSIWAGIENSIEAIYKYQNSVLGVLDTIKEDYANMDLNVNEITSKLDNPETFGMVKDIVKYFG